MEKIILIDITRAGKLLFILDNGRKIKKISKKGEHLNLLFLLNKILQENKLFFSDLLGMVLLEGGGSFSGVRQAVAILNTLHLIKKVSVLGLDKRKVGDDYGKILSLAKKKLNKNSSYLKPIYNGGPNITKPQLSRE